MVKVRARKDLITLRNTFFKDDVSPNSDLGILENAWKNMPEDVSADERLTFIDLVEKALEVVNEYKKTSEPLNKQTKN